MRNVYVVQTQVWDKTWRVVGIFSSKKKGKSFCRSFNYVRIRLIKYKMNRRNFHHINIEDMFVQEGLI